VAHDPGYDPAMVLRYQPPSIASPPRHGEFVIPDPHPPDTMRHRANATLLVRAIRAHCAGQDVYAAAEQWVYFSTAQVKNNDFRAPDVYVVRGVEDRERQAWVVWEEGGVMPHLVVELLSDTTRNVDLGEKLRVYEQVLRTPEYFVYDPFRPEAPRHFRLEDSGYIEVVPNALGRFPTRVLRGWLGTWEGTYEDIEARWLRLFDLDGEVVWTPEERAEHEAQRAEHEAQRAAALEAQLAAYRARFGELPDEG